MRIRCQRQGRGYRVFDGAWPIGFVQRRGSAWAASFNPRRQGWPIERRTKRQAVAAVAAYYAARHGGAS